MLIATLCMSLGLNETIGDYIAVSMYIPPIIRSI